MIEQLRLAVFIPSFSDGGAQRQCILLLNEWSRRNDVDLVLIRTAAGVHDHLLNEDGIRVYNLRVRSNYDIRIIPQIASVLRKHRTQVLFSWLQASDVPSYFASALRRQTKWVIAERNSRHPEDWRFALRGALGRHADAIVANSEQGLRYWDRYKPRGQTFVIGNAIERGTIDYEPEVSLHTDFLHVGRLEAQKNLPAVIDAFAEVHARRPQSSFTIVGEGTLRSALEAQVRDRGLGEKVRFTGFQRDVGRYYASAGALVSLSKYEGMPNVLSEAVIAGLPVVVSSIPEHSAVVGGDYARSVPLDATAAEIADQLLAAIGDGKFPSALSAARDRLLLSSPERMADEYMERFRVLLAT